MNYDKTSISEFTPEMEQGPWTLFWDMHSGGDQNTPYHYIFIQANEEDARAVLGTRFGENADSVNCDCCGGNYSVSESDNFANISGFHRNLKYSSEDGSYLDGVGDDSSVRYGGKIKVPVPVIMFMNQKDICIIFAKDIQDHERDPSNIPEPHYPYEWSDDYDSDESEDE